MSKLYTADRFVTIGGTTAQYVTGTGSLVTFPAIPSGADYIQNQIASAQSANMWISGNGLFGIAKIGNWASNAGYARFGHSSYDGATNFGYLQSSDGQNYINGANNYISGANVNIFETAGLERMRITSSGNVGIGTSSPGRPLTVASSNIGIRMDNSSNSNAGLEYYVSTGIFHNWLLGAQYNVANTFEITPSTTVGGTTYSTPAFVVNANGNVGIGTSSPSNLLHLSSSSSTNFIVERTGSNGVFMGLKDSSGSLSYLGSNNGDFLIQTPGSGYSTKLTVLNSGNVGIGTTSPSVKLHVIGSSESLRLGTTTSDNYFTFFNSAGTQIGDIGYDGRDTNALSIWNSSNGSVLFGSNGSERMRITSTGNVGIGTSSPSEKLTIKASGDGALFAIRTSYASNAAIVEAGQTASDGYLKIKDAVGNTYTSLSGYSGSPSYFLSDVGIGTSSPVVKLDVNGSINLTNGYNLTWGGAYGANIPTIYAVAGASSFMHFSQAGNSRGPGLAIINNGNVGIGTTSPSEKLDVSGAVRITGQATNFSLGSAGLNIDRISASGLIRIYGVTGAGSAGDLALGTDNTERMRITAAGNVGIGTTSPSEKLEVNGSIRLSDGNADGPQLKLASSGYSDWNLDNYNGSFRAYYGSSEYFRITGSGNVGIGTSAPNAKLDVNGDALINQLTIGQGPVVGQGNTALGKGALGSMVGGKSNIAVGSNANSDNDVTGLTAIGVDLNTDTNLDPLGQNCLAISQFNAAAYSNQVPHIYVPSSIAVGSSSIEDIITFDINHYVGAFIEYVITTSDGSEFAAGTVTVAWKDSGSGSLKDTRDVIWTSYMDDFDFLLSGTTVQLRNDSAQGARIRISVRAMIRT